MPSPETRGDGCSREQLRTPPLELDQGLFRRKRIEPDSKIAPENQMGVRRPMDGEGIRTPASRDQAGHQKENRRADSAQVSILRQRMPITRRFPLVVVGVGEHVG